MDLRDYLDILRARWKLITVTTLLGVAVAAIASMLATPLYTAKATVFVSVGDNQDVNAAYTGSLFAQQRVKSYVDVVTSDDVMGPVVEKLGLPLTAQQLASKVTVNNPLDTVNLDISATDPNPVLAQEIANATTKQLQQAVDVVDPSGTTSQSLVTITPVKPAEVPSSPSSPRTLINIALGFLVGLAIGVGAAVLLETLDTRIKSIEQLAKYFDQPLLGVIGFEAEAGKKPLLTDIASQSNRAESFRQVRTNLQFVDIDHRPRSLVVASAIPREGKSTTAINLAITLAQTGQPVFLIEADLRRPKIAEYLSIEGNAGLTDVLVGRATVDEVMQPWGTTGNLWVLAAGPLPPNPSELLGSQAMADLIHHLEKRATLIIDVPPLLPVTDAAVLTRLSGGALMVIATNRTRREQLRTAVSNIESVGGKILGLVLNMAPPRGPDRHRYGYGYQYDYRSTESRGKFEESAPVIPAGLGGLPGVNGSSTPTMPVGPVPKAGSDEPGDKGEKGDKPRAKTGDRRDGGDERSGDSADRGRTGRRAGDVAGGVAPPRSAAKANVTAAKESSTKPNDLKPVVPAEQKVIGGTAGVPLTASPPMPQGPSEPELLPADTASGARFGLDDDTPWLPIVDEVPVTRVEPADPTDEWTPPAPRSALDPLTAPYEQLHNPPPDEENDEDDDSR